MLKLSLPVLLVTAALAALATACGDGPDSPASPSASPDTADAAGTPIVLDGATVTASGLRYVDEVVGDGASPGESSMVTVHYIGRLASNGAKFDSSYDRGEPTTFPLGGVIKGFAEAVSTMKVGGKRIAYIPAELAYGAAGRGAAIPPDADLVFEIELIAVQ
jgi:peptidylprolyl isomerase